MSRGRAGGIQALVVAVSGATTVGCYLDRETAASVLDDVLDAPSRHGWSW